MNRFLILSAVAACVSPLFGKDALTFKETLIPVKVTPTQESFTVQFPFTNTSDKPVTIRKIKVACDCTSAGVKDNKLVYSPGESGVITATMKPGNFSGTVNKDISVITHDGEQTLIIQAIIPELIHMEPRKLEWRQGGPATPQKISITINGDYALNLTAVDLTGDAFDYDPITIKKGKSYEIIVTPKSTAKPAFNTIWVRTDSDIPRYKRQMGFLTVNGK